MRSDDIWQFFNVIGDGRGLNWFDQCECLLQLLTGLQVWGRGLRVQATQCLDHLCSCLQLRLLQNRLLLFNAPISR